MPEEPEDFTIQQKIAIIMVAMGEDAAGEIVSHLSDDDAEAIAQAITELGAISSERVDAVLEEFEQLLLGGQGLEEGGSDLARSILEKAVGEKRADEVMSHVDEKKSNGFYMLRHADAHQLIQVLEKEHPQAIALVLSQLDPQQAAAVFDGLTDEVQGDVAYRMSQIQEVSPQALEELESGLAAELKSVVDGPVTKVGGVEAVSDMLAHVGRSTESSVLHNLDVKDPEVAEQIRNRMVTFDSLATMCSAEIQLILKGIEKEDLVLSLKAASEETRKAVFAAVSKRAGRTIREDVDLLGPTRRSDVEQAQHRIAQVIRDLDAHGEVKVARGGEKDEYVE